MAAQLRVTTIGLSIGLSCCCSSLLAQEAGSLSADTGLSLEEVIVTATRREASLQDVSVAVTALSEDVLRQATAINSEQIAALVPSLNLQQGANARSSSFNIRGIGTQSFSTAVEPSVSTVVDGVVMGRSGQGFLQLLDVERVEVLRGPQGTLFGKNSSGGVVHIISKDPTEELDAEVMAGVEEDESYRAGFSVSGPLGAQVSGRLTGFLEREEGWIYNWYDDSYRNEKDAWSLRGKLLWTPTDNLALRWSSDWYEKDCTCNASALRSMDPDPEVLAEIAPVVPGEENTEINNNGDLQQNSQNQGHTLTIDWAVDNFDLTSITAWRDWDEDFVEDVDSRPTDPLNFFQAGTVGQEQFTQEFRLASPTDAAINYVVGAFFFRQSVHRTFERRIFVNTTFTDFTVDTDNIALFGEMTWNINEDVRLIAGGRFTRDEIEYTFDSFTTLNPEVSSFGDDTDEDDFSGKLAVEWSPGEDSLLYASFTQGYKGPGFSLTATSVEPTPRVEPETADAWELGWKTSLFDNRVRFNGALFYTVYEDWQAEAFVPDVDPDEPGVFLTTNAGEVSTRGIEFDITAQATQNLRLFGSLTVLDARIDDFPGGPCTFGQQFRGECPDGVQDLSGGKLPYTPDWKLTLIADYVIPWDRAGLDWVLGLNYRAQDEVLFSVAQDEFTVQDGYGILDLSVALNSQAGNFNINAYVKNVTDQFWVTGIGSTLGLFIPNGYVHFVPRRYERTAGIEFRYRW